LKRPSLRLAVLPLAVAAAFAATASGAMARSSCGEKVIDDWYGSKSGQLRHTYPLHCYKDALAIIKSRPDLDVYSNASQDILFAMQLAIAHDNGKGGPPDVTSSVDTADALPSWRGGPDAKNGGHPPGGTTVVVTKPVGRGNPRSPSSCSRSGPPPTSRGADSSADRRCARRPSPARPTRRRSGGVRVPEQDLPPHVSARQGCPSSGRVGEAAAQNKEPGFTDVVPGAAPTGYVQAYDEGRPKH